MLKELKAFWENQHHAMAWCHFSRWFHHFEMKIPTYQKNGTKMVPPYNQALFSLEVLLFCYGNPRMHKIHIFGLFPSHHWISHLVFYTSTWYTTQGHGIAYLKGFSHWELFFNLNLSTCYNLNLCNVLPTFKRILCIRIFYLISFAFNYIQSLVLYNFETKCYILMVLIPCSIFVLHFDSIFVAVEQWIN